MAATTVAHPQPRGTVPAGSVISHAPSDGVVTKMAGFVHLWRHALVYVQAGGPQGRGVRGHAVALWARQLRGAMATRRYPGDDPRRKLPDYTVVTLSGKPDGELGHMLVK
jgi:hypothetical protein